MAEATAALTELCRGGPDARFALKREINEFYGAYDRMTMEASIASDECREGWEAFAEKRAPSWIPDDLRPDGRL
jgi:hypothetical protein